MTINSFVCFSLFAFTMSEPSTPSPAPKLACVTPGDNLIETSVRMARFTPETLDLVTGVLTQNPQHRITLRTGIDILFTERWQVHNWTDLMVFSSADISAALVPDQGFPPELIAPVIVKKLGYIVDFAQFGTLTPTMTMNDIVSSVTTSKQRSLTPAAQSPTRRAVQVFDKKAVPTLDKFNGHDEDYFTWKEATVNVLGTAGFGRFLTDPAMSAQHPEVAESVFYALRGAVHGGQAQSIAQGMLDEKHMDPSVLWTALESYYDTALNRANVVLFDIRRLLNIRLDPDNTATKFISDFRNCLQRLRKNNARLSDDSDTLRALLLVAIQDDDFEMVRDSIVHKPDSSVNSILTEIRERETSLMMKDQASNMNGDGVGNARYSRRTGHVSTGTHSTRSGGSANHISNNNRKWVIPKFPDTWKHAFGGSLFKLLNEWRIDALKGRTQMQLNDNFATIVEPAPRVPPPGGGKAKAKSRRAATTGSSTSTSAESSTTPSGDNTAGTDHVDGQSDDTPRKRIRLQKSRRIVTERNA